MESLQSAFAYVNEKGVNTMSSPIVSLEEEVSKSSVSMLEGLRSKKMPTKRIEVVHIVSCSLS